MRGVATPGVARDSPSSWLLVPRLHAVTTREVLERADFQARVRDLLEAGDVALHLRARGSSGRLLLDKARTIVERWPEATVLTNDRVDVALIARTGAHLPQTGLTPAQARSILGPVPLLGRSVHEAPWDPRGLDYLLYGHVFETPSKRGLAPGGLEGLARAVERGSAAALPVIAIGGLTPARVGAAIDTGAYGVATISGIWEAADTAAAAAAYLRELDQRRALPAGSSFGAADVSGAA